MTLHSETKVREVGVRELHDHLSRHLRHVGEGGEIVVTSRGKRVARITAPDVEDPFAELRRRGLVTEPTEPKRPAAEIDKVVPSGSVSDLVAEQRR